MISASMFRLLVRFIASTLLLTVLSPAWMPTARASGPVLLGDVNIEASPDSDQSGQAEAFQFTAASSGTISTLTVYVDNGSSSPVVVAGLYTNSGQNPGQLLTQGSLSTGVVAGAWNTVNVPAVNVTKGTVYWIAVMGVGGTFKFRDGGSNCISQTSAGSGQQVLPGTWSVGSRWFSCSLSAYGSAGSGGAPPPTATLSLSSTSLSFNGTQGGANPSNLSVNITNTGAGSLTYSAVSDSSWLLVSPSSGSAPTTLFVGINDAALAAGNYTGHVTVTAAGASGGPAIITVSLVVALPQSAPKLSLSSTSLTFNGTQGAANPPNEIVNITNAGTGSLTYSAVSDSNWLVLTPTSGTAPTTLFVGVSDAALAAGNYTGHITVSAAGAGGSPAVITVSLVLAPPQAAPKLSLSTSTLTFSGTQGGANPPNASVNITNNGTGSLTYTAASDSNWLVLTPSSGTAPTTLFVGISDADLAAGNYTGHVTVSAAGAAGSPAVVTVNLVLSTPPPPPPVLPILATLQPASATAGSAAITMTLSGQNFVSGDTALWNGAALSTTFVNAGVLTAIVPANLLATVGPALVEVQTSSSAVSVPLSFTVNPGAPPQTLLIGTKTVQSGPDTDQSGNAEAFVATASVTGSLSTLSIYVDSGSASTQLFAGIYSDNNGHPGSLLANGELNAPTSAAWNTITIPDTNITAGQKYWIAVLGTGGTLNIRDGSGCNSESYAQGGLSSLPASWATGNIWPSCPLSAYGSSAGSGSGMPPSTYSLSGSIQSSSGGLTAKVALSGAASGSTTADGTGKYSFSGLANGAYVLSPSESGYTFSPATQSATVNNANVSGVNFTANQSSSTFTISGNISPATTGSGSLVTLSGAASASTTADASGNFNFTALGNGSYTITPTSQSATFSPTSQSVSVNNSNVSGVNFTASASSNVVFFDDFTGSSLNPEWVALNRHGDYSNDEVQCYLPANATVSGGFLDIASKVQTTTCGDSTHSPSSWNYTSSMVQWKTFNFTYGTVEFRAKMAGGQGSWPAIWLLGANCQASNVISADNVGACNWPNPGSDEIDMAEFSNYAADHFSSVSHHLFRSTGNGSCSQNMPNGADASQGFHVYTMTWTSSSVTFSIDGVAANCGGDPAYTSHVPNTPMFLMINNALGGGGCPNGGNCPNNSDYPQTMQVDYVKVTKP